MSLKTGERSTTLREDAKISVVIEDLQNGKKGASKRLAKYVDKGMISTDFYNELAKEYGVSHYATEKKQEQPPKKKAIVILCVILLVSLIIGAFVYHNNAIEESYNKGNTQGYARGYDVGYEKGYRFYEHIKDEYEFYHKYAVIVNSSGKKYHRYDCHHIKNRRFNIYDISTAKAKGYTACLDCY